MAAASSHCVPLVPGFINQLSLHQNSFCSNSSEQSKNSVPRRFGWLPETEQNLDGSQSSKNIFSSAYSANQSSPVHTANADSGCSGIYIALKDVKSLSNIQPCNNLNKIQVTVANGHIIESSHIGQLSVLSGHTLPGN